MGKRSADSPTPSPRAPTGHEIVTGCITLGNEFRFNNITTKMYAPTYLQWYHIANNLWFASYYWLTYILHGAESFKKANQFSASQKKTPAFYGTRGFITAFTSARYLSLFWVRSIQSTPPHPTSWRFILILSSNLRLSFPSGLFPSSIPIKTLHTPLLSPVHATCPTHLILLDFITRTIFGEEYSSLNSSLYSFFHSPVTSSLLGPNILFNCFGTWDVFEVRSC